MGVLTLTPSVPSAISSFDTLPSSTASTSMVALSVSISAMMSPGLMVWPSLTSHLASLPSSMVGDSAGIRISVDIGVLRCRLGQAERRPNTCNRLLLCWVIADARPNLHLFAHAARNPTCRSHCQCWVTRFALTQPTQLHIFQVRRLRLDGFGHVGDGFAGVLGSGRLDAHDPAFLRRRRHVLHPARHDMEVALAQRHVGPVAIANGERALAHEEELVLLGMRMPDEFALHLGDLHVLA